jgi:hypothetical protein
VNAVPVTFKIDTGAAVTAIPAGLVHCVSKVKHTNKTLKSAGNHMLKVLGCAECIVYREIA